MAPEIIMIAIIGFFVNSLIKGPEKREDKQNIVIITLIIIAILVWGNFFNDTLGSLYVKLTRLFN